MSSNIRAVRPLFSGRRRAAQGSASLKFQGGASLKIQGSARGSIIIYAGNYYARRPHIIYAGNYFARRPNIIYAGGRRGLHHYIER